VATNFTIREATEADAPVLWQMLYYAAHVDEEPGAGPNASIDAVMDNPALAKYVRGWGRAGDLGYLALEASSGRPIGAVWMRLFAGADKAYSPVDDGTPELAIGVMPEFRGQGVGSKLMKRLLAAAGARFPVIALNVRAENPAVRLYERLGFRVVGELTNRAGTMSYDMRWSLTQVQD
jgi:ribosomal protein S18 acetylase RimI-like enzyme